MTTKRDALDAINRTFARVSKDSTAGDAANNNCYSMPQGIVWSKESTATPSSSLHSAASAKQGCWTTPFEIKS